jgi:hypothetical protein
MRNRVGQHGRTRGVRRVRGRVRRAGTVVTARRIRTERSRTTRAGWRRGAAKGWLVCVRGRFPSPGDVHVTAPQPNFYFSIHRCAEAAAVNDCQRNGIDPALKKMAPLLGRAKWKERKYVTSHCQRTKLGKVPLAGSWHPWRRRHRDSPRGTAAHLKKMTPAW